MKKNILIVEDELDVRRFFKRLLDKTGHTVREAADGHEALSLARKYPPHLVLLDLHLPGGVSGFDVCRQLRQAPRTRSVRILAITGLREEGLTAKCLNHGMDVFLRKPIVSEDLLAYVNYHLTRPVRPPGRVTARSSSKDRFVLVVDDDEELTDMIEFGLAASGHKTEKAHTGAEAWDVFQRVKPDLAVLDLNLPDMNGVELCRKIKSVSRLRDIPLIALTAEAPARVKDKVIQAGFDLYMPKPFVEKEFLACIDRFLNRVPIGVKTAFHWPGFEIVPDQHVVKVGESTIQNLSVREFDLCLLLAKSVPRVVSREHLFDRLYGRVTPRRLRNIDWLVACLRRQLGPQGQNRIESIRGRGYRLNIAT